MQPEAVSVNPEVSPDEPRRLPHPARNILVVGAFPPPMGGAAKTTWDVYQELRKRPAGVRALDGSVGGVAHQGSAGYHLRRLAKFLANLQPLIFSQRADTCYMLCNAGHGMLYNLPQVAVLRLRGTRIFIHHHSYAYITAYSQVMRLLLWLLGPGAVHVFGDEAMGAAFARTYGRQLRSRHISNAATMDVTPELLPPRNRDADGKVHVGYLSNLCQEKGFDVVADVFARLAAASPDYHFEIAGPPVTAEDEALLAKVQASLGARLTYHGPVRGAAKLAFFSRLDVFVFPTRFRQEAQPNVIYEALAAGAVVIATKRAGIPAMLEGFPSRVLPDASDLASQMAAAVGEFRHAGDWPGRRAEIVARFLRVRQQALESYRALLDEMSLRPADGDETNPNRI